MASNYSSTSSSSTVAASANEILTEWESSLKSYRGHKKSGAVALLPTALQWYKLGLAWDALRQVSSSSSAFDHRTFQQHYHAFIIALPLEYHESLWNDLNQAFWTVLQQPEPEQNESSADTTSTDQKTAALRSMAQLLDGSSHAAQIGMRQWSLEHLSTLVDCYEWTTPTTPSTVSATTRNSVVLSLLRLYLMDAHVDWEQILPVLHLLQQEAHVWNALVQNLQSHYSHNHSSSSSSSSSSWKEVLLQQFDHERQQQEYLTSLLAAGGHSEEEELQHQLEKAARIRHSLQQSSSSFPRPESAAKSNPQQQDNKNKELEIQRRIRQVQSVVPDLGDGFVEAALAAHYGAVDATVTTLLEPMAQWPAILQVTDRQLPRRKPDSSVAVDVSTEEDAETRALVKATVLAVERQRREEAHLVDLVLRAEDDATTGDGASAGAGASANANYHSNDKDTGDDKDNLDEQDDEEDIIRNIQQNNEYNDDYDDLYDDMDEVGNSDVGLYDNYDAVRVYNSAMKQVVAEQNFWEESRNSNQTQPKGVAAVVGQRKQEFGPDKKKGGRIPGRGGEAGRGGRGGSGSRGDSGNATDSNEKNSGNIDGKPNLRQKARKLDKRRDQQKKAQVKRSGA